jgi:hypothetical protein
LYLRQVLFGMQFLAEGPTTIWEDNKSSIDFARNSISCHSRAKHIDIRYHFVKDLVNTNIMNLKYIPTEHQIADAFTKPLPRDRFQKLRNFALGITMISVQDLI